MCCEAIKLKIPIIQMNTRPTRRDSGVLSFGRDQTQLNNPERTAIMNTEIIFVVQESSEGGYEAKALDHSIYTEADSVEELRSMVKDAVECHFENTNRPPIIHFTPRF